MSCGTEVPSVAFSIAFTSVQYGYIISLPGAVSISACAMGSIFVGVDWRYDVAVIDCTNFLWLHRIWINCRYDFVIANLDQ